MIASPVTRISGRNNMLFINNLYLSSRGSKHTDYLADSCSFCGRDGTIGASEAQLIGSLKPIGKAIATPATSESAHKNNFALSRNKQSGSLLQPHLIP